MLLAALAGTVEPVRVRLAFLDFAARDLRAVRVASVRRRVPVAANSLAARHRVVTAAHETRALSRVALLGSHRHSAPFATARILASADSVSFVFDTERALVGRFTSSARRVSPSRDARPSSGASARGLRGGSTREPRPPTRPATRSSPRRTARFSVLNEVPVKSSASRVVSSGDQIVPIDMSTSRLADQRIELRRRAEHTEWRNGDRAASAQIGDERADDKVLLFSGPARRLSRSCCVGPRRLQQRGPSRSHRRMRDRGRAWFFECRVEVAVVVALEVD